MPGSTSSRGGARRHALRPAAACAASAALFPAAVPAADEEGCLDCHALAGFAVRTGGAARPLAISPECFEASAHGPLSCRECHVDVASIPHGESVRPVTCGQTCHGMGRAGDYSHEKIWWEHAASAHGKSVRGPIGCLASHPTPAAPAERDRLAEARRCASCHRRSARVLAWFTDSHARALLAGDGRAPSCPDCHSSHRVRGAADAESSVSPGRLAGTCSGGALAEGGGRGCHGQLAPRAVAGAGMNQLMRAGSGHRPLRFAFSLLFAGMVAGLALRAGVGFLRGR